MWTVQQPGWWNPRCSEFVHTLFAYGMPTFGQKMSYRTIWKSSSHLRITLSWSRHISQNCFELSQRIRIRNVRGSEWRFSYLGPALWLVDRGSWTHRSRFIFCLWGVCIWWTCGWIITWRAWISKILQKWFLGFWMFSYLVSCISTWAWKINVKYIFFVV